MICFHCGKEIENEQERTMLGLDRPYTNLWFHKSCFVLNVKQDINQYLQSRIEQCVTIIKNYTEKPEKRRISKQWARKD